MKKALSLFLGLVTIFTVLLVFSGRVSALSGSQFNAGRIIDDSVFYAPGELNPTAIQSFLNSKLPNCDTNGSKPYGGTTRAAYGTSRGYPPPYICLKDYRQSTPSRSAEPSLCNSYSGGTKSSAQIIYDVARSCGVNAKALIVLLQKEQSLVTDDWPWSTQYRSATGYGCPDTAPCDSEYYGFFNQVYNAARQFKRYAKDAELFRYRSGRDNYIQYNPIVSCGGTNVFIQNNATAALYNYTPYQPNASALNNLYGSGDSCGAYGNRNFWRMYNDWFGSTSGSPSYRWSIIAQEAFSDAGRTNKLPYSLSLEPGEKAYLRIKVKNTGNQVWDSGVKLATTNPRNRASPFSDSSWETSGRPAIAKEGTIFPGQYGTYEFSITAPSELKSYREYFSLVAEYRQWFPDFGLYYPINVASTSPIYSVTAVERSVYLNSARTAKLATNEVILAPGDKLYARVKIKNTGNRNLDQSFTKLGTSSPRDRTSLFRDSSWIASNRAARLNETSIAPGQTGTFDFSLTTPGNIGEYAESFAIVAEGIKWIGDDILTQNVIVQDKPPSTITAWQRLHTTQNLQSNGSKFYRLIMQGDGNLVLRNPSGKAVWATWTMGNPGAYLTMQGDGNLVMRSASNRAVWTTNTMGNNNAHLTLQGDGNIVLRNAAGGVIWATYTMGR